jgi:hypothetical protein
MDKKNIFLLFLGIIIAVIIGEVILRFYFFLTNQTIGSSEEEICHKNIYEHVSNLSDPYRFSPYFPDYLEYWEYTGARPKASWTGGNVEEEVLLPDGRKARGIYYDYNTNGQHMRGIKDVSYEKDPNTLRIVALGDSFTWGEDVTFFFSYPALLEELIPHTEVLNFGMIAIGIDTMYLRWKYEALQFHPDVVIVGIYIDDIRRANPCIIRPTIAREDDQLVITNMPPPSLQEIYENYEAPKTYSYLMDFFRYQIKYFGGVKKKQYAYGFDILELMLQEMKNQSEKEGTYFMVLLIERGNDHVNDEEELAAIAQLQELLEEIEIPYLSANSIFEQENFTPTDYLHMRVFHFMPEGYGILAQGIKNKLEEEDIIMKQKNYNFSLNTTTMLLTLTNREDSSDVKVIIPFQLFLE